jgi:light-regulated signal transduction histidine kinase (bacteriophytochrome)
MSSEPSRLSRVLVVEDNPAELRLLCEILDDEGFSVVGCASASEAIEEVRKHDFSAAVVDLRLPDLSGTQLLERIRGLSNQTRVIIHTGAGSYDSAKEAINLGAFAFVEKLSDPHELLRYVHAACRERIHGYASDLEAAVRQRTEELARSNSELEDFAYTVAHDLRSPLLTISGFSQILREDYRSRLDQDADEYLAHIHEAVTRMTRLIEDLLNYARVGRNQEPFQSVCLEEVLAQVKGNLEGAIRANQAQVRSLGLPCVQGNPTQLVQLLQNLIGNAIKFRGQDLPVVTISAQPDGDQSIVSVEDNGIGVEREHFEKVFQLFQRVHGGDPRSGTGIGLAVCKKIVQRHGGRIWLESQPGRGTTFFLTLPTSS